MRSGGKAAGCNHAKLSAAGGTGRLENLPDDRTAECPLSSEPELNLVEINQGGCRQQNLKLTFKNYYGNINK